MKTLCTLWIMIPKVTNSIAKTCNIDNEDSYIFWTLIKVHMVHVHNFLFLIQFYCWWTLSQNFVTTGFGYHPLYNYTYTSSFNGAITRYDTILNDTAISLTNHETVLQRPQNISLITVDWLNSMLYWQEVFNTTHCRVSFVLCIFVGVNHFEFYSSFHLSPALTY